MQALRKLLLCLIPALLPVAAQAGWVIDWSTTAVNATGERMATQRATQSIAGNKLRMQQPTVVTVIDYNKDRFTVINTEKEYFWTGSVEEYVREMQQGRQAAMRERVAVAGMADRIKRKATEEAKARDTSRTPLAVDKSTLPPISITNTGQKEKIAGYDTEKYDVKVDGELFQEFWFAPGLNLSADLDAAKYLAQQEKTGAGMAGKSAKAHNALYHDPQYRALMEKGFVLKSVVHHLAGGYERVATSVAQKDVPASVFAVPEDYRRVRLDDLFDPPPTPAARPKAGTGIPSS